MVFLFFIFMQKMVFAKTEELQFLKKNCLQELSKKTDKEAICSCYETNLGSRIDEDFLKVLSKSKRKLSVSKELREMEGITPVFHFEKSVMSECSKNAKWVVGPEDKGEPDEIPAEKKTR